MGRASPPRYLQALVGTLAATTGYGVVGDSPAAVCSWIVCRIAS